MKLTRDEIYEQVWQQPLAEVASSLGMSVETLRRICGLLEIPVPKAGHWRRVKVPRRKVLPKLKKDEASFVSLVKRGERLVIDPASIPGAQASRGSGSRVKEPHPLIERAQKFYAYPKLGPDGRMKPSSNSAPNLRVTEGQKQRALTVMDRLFKLLEEKGCELEWKGSATVTTPDTSVRVSIQEEVTAKERPPTPEEAAKAGRNFWPDLEPKKYYRDEPSGRLIIAIETYYYTAHGVREWKDEGRSKLESRVEEVAEGIVAYAKELRRAREAEAERSRRYEEDLRRRQEEERLRQVEQARRDRLTKSLDSWERAAKIRQYADELESAWKFKHGGSPDEANETWLKWMRDHADRIDPLISDI